ncbi:MAG TPA: PDZ domain-containing protein [Ohtaekwangia sp.]|nr:PDZ domain-containing protein [Ohtaekwangia sp.]
MNTSPAFIRIMRSYFNALLFVLFSLSIATSCSDDDVSPKKQDNDLPKADPYVNTWILENMKDYYFWNEQLPANPDTDKDPAGFFSSLLHQDDRFSWIQDNYIELLNSMQGINKEAGFEYTLYRESTAGTGIVAQVMYVKPNSPAEVAGLKRGDLISHINDTKITTINYETLIQGLKENHSFRYKPIVVGEDRFGSEKLFLSVQLSLVKIRIFIMM